MRQNTLGGLAPSQTQSDPDRYAHGGNVRKLAERAGKRLEDILDFSASINPLGPPGWLEEEVAAALAEVAHYPDPEASDLTLAACERYKVWPNQALAGNGVSELLLAVCQLAAHLGLARAVIPTPAYVDVDRCCRLAGLAVETLPCAVQNGFAPDLERLAGMLAAGPALVMLASPNNPTGTLIPARHIRDMARAFPKSLICVDESFADFVPGMEDETPDQTGGGVGRVVRNRPDNVLALVSMTKFYAVPGLRLGLCFGPADLIARLRRLLPAWNLGVAAQRVGARALRDADYQRRTVAEVARLRQALAAELRDIPGLRVFPSQANFLLCRLDRVGLSAKPLADRLMAEEGIAIRLCANFEGLDESYFRIAVRTAEENARLVAGIARFSGIQKAPVSPQKVRRTPAIMVQGTCSGAGKSVLAAGLCRILFQDGFDVAPFKAQNMSNNSAVAVDASGQGFELGRAQATQAQACRLSPDPRMNPVLLKPTGDTGSQVVVLGRAVGNMNVREYHAYKPQAWQAATQAYDSLAAEHQVMVLEGAGSPAEVNLKAQDIVNMAMARHAGAKVLLAGDIDRGGVFAALSGTYDILDPDERALVLGHVLNKFRGDASILDPALDFLYRRTGRPVLGVVPWLPSLDIPEEDSLGVRNLVSDASSSDFLDIAVIVPGRIANFNDLDPLRQEPDVRLRLVRQPTELGTPDAVILPGSKNTIEDLRALRGAGFAAALRSLPESSAIVGICAGLQMLGTAVHDPHGLETNALHSQPTVDGFGLLPLTTVLEPDKTLTRVTLADARTGHTISGYEIHHGVTRLSPDSSTPAAIVLARTPDSRELSFGLDDERLANTGFPRIWGTYAHGVFDSDPHRRAFLNSLRAAKNLPPLAATTFSLEPALDRLADHLRRHLDMPRIYAALGLGRGLLG